jgi:ankyrin repeat protein
VLLSCVCWFVVVQGFTALIRAAIWNKLSVVEILLQAGADVNHRTNRVGDGDVWDTTQMDMQYSLCRLSSLHSSWFHVFCSVLFLCWYFMSIFMFMFIVCECVISLSCYYLSG